MVKFTSAFLVFATLALSVFASPVEQRDVNKVKNDLHQVAHQVMSLNDMISSLGASVSIGQAMTLRSQVMGIDNGIEETTKDVREVANVSVPDAKDIMFEVEQFIPAIVAALRNLKTKKNAFLSIPIKGAINLFRQLLQELHAHSTALAEALITAAPDTLKAQATRDKDTVEAAFKDVIDFFAH